MRETQTGLLQQLEKLPSGAEGDPLEPEPREVGHGKESKVGPVDRGCGCLLPLARRRRWSIPGG